MESLTSLLGLESLHPIDFDDEIFHKAVENHTFGLNGLRQPFSRVMNITPERFDELVDDMRKEMPEYESFAQSTRVYGRKKFENSHDS